MCRVHWWTVSTSARTQGTMLWGTKFYTLSEERLGFLRCKSTLMLSVTFDLSIDFAICAVVCCLRIAFEQFSVAGYSDGLVMRRACSINCCMICRKGDRPRCLWSNLILYFILADCFDASCSQSVSLISVLHAVSPWKPSQLIPPTYSMQDC